MKTYSKHEKIAFLMGLVLSLTVSIYLVVFDIVNIATILVINALIYIGSFVWSKKNTKTINKR